MKLSFRDRFFTPVVARAMTSSSAIVSAGMVAAAGAVVGGPIGLVVGAIVGWGARVAVAVPRNEAGPEIEPRALNNPWRSYVERALDNRARFWRVVETTRKGPLADELRQIAERVDKGVEETWQVAERGNALSGVRAQVAVPEIQRQLQQTSQAVSDGRIDAETRETYRRTAEALQAQLQAAQRMEGVITRADAQLRLLDARLAEVVTRAAELTASSSDASVLGSLGQDVDSVVIEMEALRQALEDAGNLNRGLPA